MFGLIKKKLKLNTLGAVCPDQDGIAIAQVRQDKGVPPILELCTYQNHHDAQAEKNPLKKIAEHYDLGRMACVSTMELDTYNLLMVEAPDVQPEELRAAIRWKIKDLIDFHIDDSVVDVFEVPDTKAAAGRNKMMYAVVSRSALVKSKIDKFLDSDINLTVIDIPELALRNIASLLPEDVGGVAMVYLGQEKGLITITRQSTLFLSRRIEKGLNTLPDSMMQDNDEEVTRDWLNSIIVEIQRSLDYYESHFSNSQVSSIVLTPLPRSLDGVTNYISEQLGLPARILDVNSLIDVPQHIDQKLQSECILAIGAALRKESKTL